MAKIYPKTFQVSVPDEPLEPGEFDVEKLLSNSGEILRREITNLLMESSRGKLGATSARDLVAYVRLLVELKLKQEEELAGLTDEELKARAKV